MLGFGKLEIAGFVAGLIALVAVPWALLASMDAARAKREVAALQVRIDHPTTGYVARLASCKADAANLRGAVNHQNAAVAAWEAEAARLQREGVAAVGRAQAETRAAQRRATDILRAQPRAGEDQCAAAARLIEESLR